MTHYELSGLDRIERVDCTKTKNDFFRFRSARFTSVRWQWVHSIDFTAFCHLVIFLPSLVLDWAKSMVTLPTMFVLSEYWSSENGQHIYGKLRVRGVQIRVVLNDVLSCCVIVV